MKLDNTLAFSSTFLIFFLSPPSKKKLLFPLILPFFSCLSSFLLLFPFLHLSPSSPFLKTSYPSFPLILSFFLMALPAVRKCLVYAVTGSARDAVGVVGSMVVVWL